MNVMAEEKTLYVALQDLRIGMFVYLDLGWMSHPFPSSSFKISNTKQLETIRSLGLTRVRYSPDKSDLDVAQSEEPSRGGTGAPPTASEPGTPSAEQLAEKLAMTRAQARLAAQRHSIAVCEEQFSKATVACFEIMGNAIARPDSAREQSQALVNAMVDKMMSQGESLVHLLSDGSGERAALHPVNVTVLSLLLGKALNMDHTQLRELGLSALLHDLGKEQLPTRVRWADSAHSPSEEKAHRSHVSLSVEAVRRMALSPTVQLTVAQHHEMVDGSGYPLGVHADAMPLTARVLALVNRYDNLCNPFTPSTALTPHEALAVIFAQAKTRFDALSLNAFIRLMGVYPPGSVVQLADDRYGLVMSVNAARPLRPLVMLYDATVPKEEALVFDLQTTPELGIRRSLKPLHLPQAVLGYLSPRKRISYYFDQTPEATVDERSV